MLPDFLTVFAMTATSAFTLAWVVAALGQKFWRQGMGWAVCSTLFYAFAYTCYALQAVYIHSGWGVLGAALVSAALATFTLALQRFQQLHHVRSDIALVTLPITATLVLSLLYIPSQPERFVSWQSAVVVVQALLALWMLVHMRRHTPGNGWWLVSCAMTVLLLSQLFMVFVPMGARSATAIGHPWMVWLVCLGLLLRLVASTIGFLIMLHNRQTALEQGKSQLDPLTKLPNRAALVIRLEEAIHQSADHDQPLAIMVLDIDHFKNVNDTYGHLVGDQVIQHLAGILKTHGRSDDFAARYGGEEFVLVLPNTPTRHAFTYAESLCQAVRKAPLRLASGQMLHITISIGVYVGTPAHGSGWQRLVGVADEAMYVAKRSGRDRVAMSAAVQAMQTQTHHNVF